jgi:adenylate cyclase
MAAKRFWKRFLETRYFGLVIGLLVFVLLMVLSLKTVIVGNIEQKVLDFNFRLKNTFSRNWIQEGVSLTQRNPKISPDILIVGIDDKSLDRFGKWPFPRYRFSDLIDSFSHIKNQNERERNIFVDVFFNELDKAAEDDARLVESIRWSGRVFLETVLQEDENVTEKDEEFSREEILSTRLGTIENIVGDWTKVETYKGVLAPLKPYARAAYGYGQPNFRADPDQVYRRDDLIVKLARLEKEIPLDSLTVDEPLDRKGFERLAWIDKQNVTHNVPYPLTPAVLADLKRQMEKSAPQKAQDTNNDNNPDSYYYVVRKYRDVFIPAMPLSLAVDYFHKKFSDIEVVLGKHIRIPSPEQFNIDTQAWEPYKQVITPPQYDQDGNQVAAGTYRPVPEIRIPINETGSMLINFMGLPSSAAPGGNQTFPVRPFTGYAGSPPSSDPEKWPQTKKVANNILMVGIFTEGLAQDQKPTPYGLMYGVEIHTNALNTILMGNFIRYAEPWITMVILALIIMLTAFMVSRLSTIWSLMATLLSMIVYFFVVILVFETNSYVLTLSSPIIGSFLCFLAVVAYRTMTEEKDKRRIRDMFGKYVSPSVVEEILENPPELGGVDKELTVFFSDIRGFTTLSESMTPQELVNHLNAYLTAMTDVIMEYQGTLDKYVGDEVMCFWGAPLPQPDHAEFACKCSLKQIEVLNKLNEGWPPEKRLSIGIGLNSGIMTIGNMGSMGRMNYTLMGDNVNLGARLEGTNKQYYTTIIISEFTYEHVKDKVIAREMDNIRVKGKNKPVLIYELIDMKDGLEPPPPLAVKGKRQ